MMQALLSKRLYVYLAVATVFFVLPRLAYSQSFTVDSLTAGLIGSEIDANGANPENIYTAYDTTTGTGFAETNFLDRSSLDLGLFPQVDVSIDAVSAGYDPVNALGLWDVLFSVSRTSTGLSGNPSDHFAVNQILGLGQSVGANLFYTNPNLQGHNRWLAAAGDNPAAPFGGLGLVDTFDSEVTGMDVFDSRAGVETAYRGFSDPLLPSPEDAYLSIEGDAIINTNLGGGALAQAEVLGLTVDDDIDALALDIGGLPTSDGMKALFSLAPGSASLNGPDGDPGTGDDYSPADIFYTDFNDTFAIAGPANISFPFDLTAENLGLQPSDNVDGLDIIATSTVYSIDQTGDLIPPFVPEIGRRGILPEPSSVVLLMISSVFVPWVRRFR